ncbi:nuclear transport factor 2 family protein [Roseovarius sp. A46]|uniref:nuclear transport factor 2 family protein n=1 Tax=Roseovarius sp. A46 TaxID=2109331 RepID=UPI001F504A58|nr:nuclear transport factor 2 family protein [Roseovarius sp. A46]
MSLQTRCALRACQTDSQPDQRFSNANRLQSFLSNHRRQEETEMQTADETPIREAIDRYVEGMRTADVALLKSAFHEHANLFGDFDGDLMAAPIGTFFDWVSEELEPGATGAEHRVEIEDVEIAGDVALARLHERDFFGGDAREFFMLVRSDDGWRITCKSWSTIG